MGFIYRFRKEKNKPFQRENAIIARANTLVEKTRGSISGEMPFWKAITQARREARRKNLQLPRRTFNR